MESLLNTKNKIILWILVILIVIFVLSFFLPKQKETIRIGALIPLTGTSANYGETARGAIDMAVEEINKEGGINGKKIEIIYEDSKGEPAPGVSAITKLINIDKVHIILGPIMSSVTLAIAPIAEQNKVIVMTVSSSPDITNAGDYIFRNREKATQQSEKMAEFIFKELGVKELATLYIKDDTGEGHHSPLIESFKNLGGKILISESYNPGTKDFRPQLTKIKNLNPKIIHLSSKQTDVGNILKQAREIGIDAQFVGSSGSEGKDVLDIAGDAAEGLIYTMPAGEATKPEVINFHNKFKEKCGDCVEIIGALFYDSVKIIKKVMEECEYPEDTDCLKDGLYKIKDYNGASGGTTLDENGDATKTIILKTIKNGEFVPYTS